MFLGYRLSNVHIFAYAYTGMGKQLRENDG
jgi:hypothetical protein